MVREVTRNDKEMFVELCQAFYKSEAVLHPIPKENHYLTFDELMRSEEYTKAYFIELDDHEVAGYALIAKTFSQEAGGMVAWIEELFIKSEYRSKGLGHEFFDFFRSYATEKNYDYSRVRIEIEPDNVRAGKFYEQQGFKKLDYVQLVKEIEN